MPPRYDNCRVSAWTGGSRAVLVGDIDTGLDYLHPDLSANVDDASLLKW